MEYIEYWANIQYSEYSRPCYLRIHWLQQDSQQLRLTRLLCTLSRSSSVWLFATPWTVAYQAPLWDSPGKNMGVGCHALLQGIFPSQGSNPGLPRCRRILSCLSHQGSHQRSYFSFIYGLPSPKIKDRVHEIDFKIDLNNLKSFLPVIWNLLLLSFFFLN